MALSDYEKEVLQQMEDELRRADPHLESEMSAAARAASRPGTAPGRLYPPRVAAGRLDPHRVAAGSVLAVAGLGVVLAGVAIGYSIWSILLGVLGFVMMVGGVLLALRTDSRGRRRPRKTPGDRTGRPSGWSGFISGQQERWDRRDRR